MARNRQASFAKRKKEQIRQEKSAQKRARRGARADDKAQGLSPFGGIDDNGGIDRPDDDEIQRAIDHAMNPGKRRQALRGESVPTAKLFIGNVDHDVNEGEIAELFKNAGFDVVTTRIGRDRATGESRGFAFIELASDRQAVEATMKLQGATLSSRELRIQAADKRPSR